MGRIQARTLTEEERQELTQGLKDRRGVVVRRSQVLLMSADDGRAIGEISERLNYNRESVRQVIYAFNADGASCIYPRSSARPDDQRAFNDAAREQLRAIIVCSPRDFGCETSLWTLDLLADVSYEQGLTTHRVHRDTVSETLKQMGLPWKRAKQTIHSPDPNYAGKKSVGTGSKRWR